MMTKNQTAEVVTFVAKAHRSMDTDATTMRVWHALLSDLDGPAVMDATMSLLRKPSPFPPTPGQIRAEVDRLDGSTPPSEQAALGYYLAGKAQWSAHPAVERAAKSVMWDPTELPDRATWDFKAAYARELDREQNGHVRTELGSGNGPQRIALALPHARPPCETCHGVRMVEAAGGAVPCKECA